MWKIDEMNVQAKMVNKLQAKVMPAVRSPSGLKNTYAAKVASRKSSMRKTNNFVRMPALCMSILTLNASNTVQKTNMVIQLWYSENGRCTQT